jgi:hypothetical protein
VLKALHRKGVSLGRLVAADLAFDNQAYVVYDGRELRACRGGDRRGGAGETPVLGCRSVRDPYEYCGVNRNRLFGKNRRWLTLG